MKLPIKNNRIVADLNKVVWANLNYRNQYGNVVEENILNQRAIKKGEYFSIRNEWYITKTDKFKGQNAYEYAKKHNLIDIWTPELTLQLGANHRLVYTGEKALSIWEAWKAKIFGGSK